MAILLLEREAILGATQVQLFEETMVSFSSWMYDVASFAFIRTLEWMPADLSRLVIQCPSGAASVPA